MPWRRKWEPSILAWRIPGTGEPGGLPSMGSHRVGHDWSDLAAAAAVKGTCRDSSMFPENIHKYVSYKLLYERRGQVTEAALILLALSFILSQKKNYRVSMGLLILIYVYLRNGKKKKEHHVQAVPIMTQWVHLLATTDRSEYQLLLIWAGVWSKKLCRGKQVKGEILKSPSPYMLHFLHDNSLSHNIYAKSNSLVDCWLNDCLIDRYNSVPSIALHIDSSCLTTFCSHPPNLYGGLVTEWE